METLANIGEFVGGLAVALSLLYVAFQLRQNRIQARADALQRRIDTRIGIFQHCLDQDALRSAEEKFFEHELYKRDASVFDIEELNDRERRAIEYELRIELIYFQNLFYQRRKGLIDHDETLPLDYMRCFRHAPQRRMWKDIIRISGHFPAHFIAHADTIVARYDEVERRMDADQDAEFLAVVADVFDIPAPPPPGASAG